MHAKEWEYTSVTRTRLGSDPAAAWDVDIEAEAARLAREGWTLVSTDGTVYVDGFAVQEVWSFRRPSPTAPQNTLPSPAPRR